MSLLNLFRTRDATAQFLHSPTLSVDKQFAILAGELRDAKERGALGELVLKHFGGRIVEAHRLFTLSQTQYLAWARQLPESAFVSTEPSLRDDFYLLQDDSGWALIAQERGMENWRIRAKTRTEALEIAYRRLCPYEVFERLPTGES